MIDLDKLAALLDDAVRTGMAVDQSSQIHPDLDVTAGDGVQRLSIQRRLDRGEQWVGMLTSRAKMRQVGVDQVIWGRLTDAMRIGEGGEFGLDALLMATPEYNGGYTAPLKNALDWASRPTETDRSGLAAMTGKPAALISASPGTLGGIRSQTALRVQVQKRSAAMLGMNRALNPRRLCATSSRATSPQRRRPESTALADWRKESPLCHSQRSTYSKANTMRRAWMACRRRFRKH
jgi:hypothetical protein